MILREIEIFIFWNISILLAISFNNPINIFHEHSLTLKVLHQTQQQQYSCNHILVIIKFLVVVFVLSSILYIFNSLKINQILKY